MAQEFVVIGQSERADAVAGTAGAQHAGVGGRIAEELDLAGGLLGREPQSSHLLEVARREEVPVHGGVDQPGGCRACRGYRGVFPHYGTSLCMISASLGAAWSRGLSSGVPVGQ